MTSIDYPGSELDLFSHATNWKSYWASQVAPFVRGRVLDVGAGIGSTIANLAPHTDASWTALEPDAALAQRIRNNVATSALPASTTVVHGTVRDLAPSQRFDTILYIDVLEHIENDRQELAAASEKLDPGGHLIVLAPAHQWLFSPFDRAIGHFRRYTRRSLLSAMPSSLQVERMRYLDFAGLAASLANKCLLRSASPTRAQITTWDKLLVPISMALDRGFGWRFGKSVLLVGNVSTHAPN
jgi:SAM-dependent methyltransferase